MYAHENNVIHECTHVLGRLNIKTNSGCYCFKVDFLDEIYGKEIDKQLPRLLCGLGVTINYIYKAPFHTGTQSAR